MRDWIYWGLIGANFWFLVSVFRFASDAHSKLQYIAQQLDRLLQAERSIHLDED